MKGFFKWFFKGCPQCKFNPVPCQEVEKLVRVDFVHKKIDH